jgi:hypothetical protein
MNSGRPPALAAERVTAARTRNSGISTLKR